MGCKLGDDGQCMEGAWAQLVVANLVEVVAICGWVGGLSALVFIPLRMLGLLRADDAVQETGMDSAKHSPSKAYSIDEKAINTAKRVTLETLNVEPQKKEPDAKAVNMEPQKKEPDAKEEESEQGAPKASRGIDV